MGIGTRSKTGICPPAWKGDEFPHCPYVQNGQYVGPFHITHKVSSSEVATTGRLVMQTRSTSKGSVGLNTSDFWSIQRKVEADL